MTHEIEKLYDILASFLGEAKNGFNESSFQYQFPCPRCIENKGQREARKYNLEVNIQKQVFKCWSCSSEDDVMKGSVIKLIKMYGSDALLAEYKDTIRSIHESDLYKLHFNKDDFNIDTSMVVKEDLKLPSTFQLFDRNKRNHYSALKYVMERGLTWDILEKYKMGYTLREEDDGMKKYSYRVIIPSYDRLGELNYWVGRDFLPKNDQFTRTKYANPKAEKTEIIFNEEKVQWDADITLVEGAFDHIVVPNSIPLLGKALDTDYKLYWELITRANAHGRLYDRIRYIPVGGDEDPSSLFEKGGYKAIVEHLRNARQIDEVYLQ